MRRAGQRRRGRDLNPRTREGHLISSEADSAALAPLPVAARHARPGPAGCRSRAPRHDRAPSPWSVDLHRFELSERGGEMDLHLTKALGASLARPAPLPSGSPTRRGGGDRGSEARSTRASSLKDDADPFSTTGAIHRGPARPTAPCRPCSDGARFVRLQAPLSPGSCRRR